MPPGGFFDPSSLYGGQYNWGTTPVVGGPGGYLAENPQAAYTRFTSTFGGQNNDPYSRWLQQQFSQAYQGYQAALATNPNLGFGRGENDYLQGLGANFFQNRWNRMAPQQRGITNQTYGGGRTRWSLV